MTKKEKKSEQEKQTKEPQKRPETVEYVKKSADKSKIEKR